MKIKYWKKACEGTFKNLLNSPKKEISKTAIYKMCIYFFKLAVFTFKQVCRPEKNFQFPIESPAAQQATIMLFLLFLLSCIFYSRFLRKIRKNSATFLFFYFSLELSSSGAGYIYMYVNYKDLFIPLKHKRSSLPSS